METVFFPICFIILEARHQMNRLFIAFAKWGSQSISGRSKEYGRHVIGGKREDFGVDELGGRGH